MVVSNEVAAVVTVDAVEKVPYTITLMTQPGGSGLIRVDGQHIRVMDLHLSEDEILILSEELGELVRIIHERRAMEENPPMGPGARVVFDCGQECHWDAGMGGSCMGGSEPWDTIRALNGAPGVVLHADIIHSDGPAFVTVELFPPSESGVKLPCILSAVDVMHFNPRE